MSDASAQAPDDPSLADAAHSWRSAYVHIPFCARRCPYCDFAIVDESAGPHEGYAEYVEAIVSEIGMGQRFGPLDAIDLGGGTPTRLDAASLGRIVDALTGRYGTAEGAEVSIEANPEDWSPAVADSLVGVGFTRVSLGAQSFDESILGVLGRQHNVGSAARAVASARDAGFTSIGVDLIYGHPAETESSWRATVDAALSLDVDHVSAYALTVETGTALSRSIAAGADAPDDDIQAERYAWFVEAAALRGLVRYEVSNFARPGHACAYNLSTWAHGEYLGFGLGAHDHVDRIRSRNHRRLDRYLADVLSGERPRLGSETLSQGESERDRFMVGIRLAVGAPMTSYAEAFLASAVGGRLLAAGVIDVRSGRVVVTNPMLTDGVARAALSVSPPDC